MYFRFFATLCLFCGVFLFANLAFAQDTTVVNNIDSLLFYDQQIKSNATEGETQNPMLEPDLSSPLLQLPDPRSFGRNRRVLRCFAS